MMRYALSIQPVAPQDTLLLSALASLCASAGRFFQLAARHASASNLRYQFTTLANIHLQANRQLPAADAAAALQQISPQLAAIQFWYLQQQSRLRQHDLSLAQLTELRVLLQQQLVALKQLTQSSSANLKGALAHLTAALQVACDQLLPLLQVLPACGQKFQTKN